MISERRRSGSTFTFAGGFCGSGSSGGSTLPPGVRIGGSGGSHTSSVVAPAVDDHSTPPDSPETLMTLIPA